MHATCFDRITLCVIGEVIIDMRASEACAGTRGQPCSGESAAGALCQVDWITTNHGVL
jgi:hypothetical protein